MNYQTIDQNSQPGLASALARNTGDIPPGLDCIPQIRFSSNQQFESYSAERQDELVRETCKRFDWTYNADLRLEDLGVSASAVDAKTGLPHILSPEAALGALLERWEKNEINLAGKVMGSESVNRFLRLTLGVATSVFWRLVGKGLSFYFINDNLFIRPGDENNLTKQLIMLIKFDASHNMASELGKRILDTLEIRIRRAQQGQPLEWSSSLPGYIFYRAIPTDHFEWDPINYPTLMRLVNEAIPGKSLHSIATALNEEHIPTFKDGCQIRKGKKSRNRNWSASTVQRILTSPALIGTLHIKIKKKGREREVSIQNYLLVDGKPAVTQEQWAKLQARFRQQYMGEEKYGASASTPADRVISLFPEIVKCGVCGRGMTAGHYHSGKRGEMTYRRWVCQGKVSHSSACGHPVFYCDPLEAHFFTTYLRKSPDEVSTKRNEQGNQQLDAARVEMASVSEQIVALIQKGTNPAYTGCENEINAVLVPLRARKEVLKAEIAKLDNSRTPSNEEKTIQTIWDILRGDEVYVDALLSTAEKFMSRLHDSSVRRKLLVPIKSIVSKVEINADTQEYRVTSKEGVTSGWMSVATGMKAIRQMRLEESTRANIRALATRAAKKRTGRPALATPSSTDTPLAQNANSGAT